MAYLYAMRPVSRLRDLRKAAGFTQAQLANLTGVSQPAISQIENDETPMTIDHMRTFARIFACATADLLGDQDNPDRLTDDERSLLEQYRSAADDQQEIIRRVAEPLHPYRAQGAA